jgi:flagellar motility protein MotE (MotC chaperone)
MRVTMLVLAVCLFSGCIPTPVRELSTVEGKLIEAYVPQAEEALDNSVTIYKAMKAQGKITQEELDRRLAEIEKVRAQGKALGESHDALDKWIQVQGPAEALKETAKAIVPLIPSLVP